MGAIIYLVLAGILAGGAWAIKSKVESNGAEKALAPLAAFTTACADRKPADCVKEWQDAVAKNVSLQVDVNRLDAERKLCSDGVKAQGQIQAAVDAAKFDAIAKMASATKAAQSEAAAQRAKSKEPPKPGVTCEQTLNAVDVSLGELATRRMRDFSVDAVGSGGKSPATGAGSGADTLRISP